VKQKEKNLMAINGIYRLSARWENNLTGDDIVNVWHFRQDEITILDTPGEDLVQAFVTECIPVYAALVAASYTLNLFSVRQVEGGEEIYEEAVSHPGTRGTAATQLPSTVACVLSWKTGLAGRRRRGRTYMPVTVEGDLDTGQFIAAYLDGVDAFALNMIDDMATGTVGHAAWAFGIWSAPQTVPLPTPPTMFTQVTQGIARANPGTVRSRRAGSGS
jgi:hypothetical protein